MQRRIHSIKHDCGVCCDAGFVEVELQIAKQDRIGTGKGHRAAIPVERYRRDVAVTHEPHHVRRSEITRTRHRPLLEPESHRHLIGIRQFIRKAQAARIVECRGAKESDRRIVRPAGIVLAHRKIHMAVVAGDGRIVLVRDRPRIAEEGRTIRTAVVDVGAARVGVGGVQKRNAVAVTAEGRHHHASARDWSRHHQHAHAFRGRDVIFHRQA